MIVRARNSRRRDLLSRSNSRPTRKAGFIAAHLMARIMARLAYSIAYAIAYVREANNGWEGADHGPAGRRAEEAGANGHRQDRDRAGPEDET